MIIEFSPIHPAQPGSACGANSERARGPRKAPSARPAKLARAQRRGKLQTLKGPGCRASRARRRAQRFKGRRSGGGGVKLLGCQEERAGYAERQAARVAGQASHAERTYRAVQVRSALAKRGRCGQSTCRRGAAGMVLQRGLLGSGAAGSANGRGRGRMRAAASALNSGVARRSALAARFAPGSGAGRRAAGAPARFRQAASSSVPQGGAGSRAAAGLSACRSQCAKLRRCQEECSGRVVWQEAGLGGRRRVGRRCGAVWVLPGGGRVALGGRRYSKESAKLRRGQEECAGRGRKD